MDPHEDSLSFKTATDNESSEEDFVDSVDPLLASSTGEEPHLLSQSSSRSSLASRPSTPYHQFLPKRTTPKRPAPLPPPLKPSASNHSIGSTSQGKDDLMEGRTTTFAEQFRKFELNAPKGEAASRRVLGSLANHPIVLTNPQELDPPSTSFSNLKIRLIDDESESEIERLSSSGSRSSLSLAPSEDSTSKNAQEKSASVMSINSITTSTGSVVNHNQPFATCTTYSSQGLQGVPYCTFPPLQNLSPFNNASHIYENVISQQLTANSSSPYHPLPNPYLTPYAQLASPYQYNPMALVASPPLALSLSSSNDTASPPFGKLHGTEASGSPPKKDTHPLSGTSIVQRTKSAFLTSPSRQELSRLSEAEEEDEVSESLKEAPSYSQSWDYVRDPGRKVKRSDSVVTVAHLYEDIIVSPRFKVKVTLTNLAVVIVIAAFIVPNYAALLFNAFRLVFGTLFPAYYSYKAVRTKNIQEYVKWMMYWIVFAFFTCIETITDVLLSFWFPFYYELKILVVLWLLSPATKGSSILYRKFVHPWLTRREEEIDECIAKAKQQGYTTVVQLGTKGVNYATSVIMQTAIKGGGGLVNQLKRSYSTSEINEDTADMNRNVKALTSKDAYVEEERIASSGSYENEPRHRSESESSCRPRGHSTGRTARANKARSADVSDVYFHDVPDAAVPQRRSPRTHESSNSISVPISHQPVTRKSRTGDISSYATLPRTSSKRTAAKKKQM